MESGKEIPDDNGSAARTRPRGAVATAQVTGQKRTREEEPVARRTRSSIALHPDKDLIKEGKRRIAELLEQEKKRARTQAEKRRGEKYPSNSQYTYFGTNGPTMLPTKIPRQELSLKEEEPMDDEDQN